MNLVKSVTKTAGGSIDQLIKVGTTAVVAGIVFVIGAGILGVPIAQALAGAAIKTMGGQGMDLAGNLLIIDGILGLFGLSIVG